MPLQYTETNHHGTGVRAIVEEADHLSAVYFSDERCGGVL